MKLSLGSGWLRYGFRAFVSILTVAIVSEFANAQVIPDGTLGTEGSIVTGDVIRGGVGDRISGGARRGQNLFHSFSRFDVLEGRSAYFENPAGVQNIFSRVTGSDRSTIFGRLGVIQAGSTDVLGTANLFFVNPNGILFGAPGSLDVGGSFVATTANAIRFGDRGSFSATNPELPSPLLIINPSAFLFNQILIRDIASQSTTPNPPGSNFLGLRVANGQSLMLLGGNITIDGGGVQAGLNAFGGGIHMGAVAEAGSIELSPDSSFQFPSDMARGDISFTNTALADVMSDGGGSIVLTGRNLTLTDGSRLLAGIFSGLGSLRSQAGNLILSATDGVQIDQSSRVANDVGANASGNGGNVQITAGSLSLLDRSQISASTRGQGNSGNISIDTREQVVLDHSLVFNTIGSQDETPAFGDSRGINITAASVLLRNGSQLINGLYNGSKGNSGDVRITAQGVVSLEGVPGLLTNTAIFASLDPKAEGRGGTIEIIANSFSMNGGVQLTVENRGRGDAGSVIIRANDRVSLDNSRIDSTIGQGVEGQGGDIRILTGSLVLKNNSRLAASNAGRGSAGDVIVSAKDQVSFDNSFALTRLQQGANGSGGSIEIFTGSLSLTNDAQLIADTQGIGDAGKVSINASGQVTIDRSAIFNSIGSENRMPANGNSGGIIISAESLFLRNSGALVNGLYGGANGTSGDVRINAQNVVSLEGVPNRTINTAIFASLAPEAIGQGGNIQISTGSLFLTNGAQLTVATSGQGNAGSVIINARDQILLDDASNSGRAGGILTSSFTSGSVQAGNIVLNTRLFSISNGAVVNARTESDRPAGNITINTDQFVALSGGQVITTTRGTGAAGGIVLNAGNVFLSGQSTNFTERLLLLGQGIANEGKGESGLFADTRPESRGAGGNIAVSADRLSLNDGAILSAQSQGRGNAGNIQLNIRDRLELTNSSIVTAAPNSSGGNISVNNARGFGSGVVVLRNSDITTESGTNLLSNSIGGDGGNITLSGAGVIALGDSNIVARALQGRGGNITLSTFFSETLPPGNSDQFKGNGQVDVNARGSVSEGRVTTGDTSFIQNSLGDLQQTAIDPDTLIANSCIARTEQGGTFLVTGAEGLRDRPGDPFISNYPLGNVRSLPETAASASRLSSSQDRPWQLGDPIVEPQGIYRLSNGRLMMSRECS